MALTKAEKATIIERLTKAVAGATSAVFIGFTKITIHETDEVRQALRTEGVKYTVVKKTLLAKSLKDAGVSGESPDMPGEVALVYLPKEVSDDMTAPARGMGPFIKKFKDKLTFLGGVVDGAFASKDAVAAIAAIPPVPVLRGMFVNIINAPIQRFAIALGQVATKK